MGFIGIYRDLTGLRIGGFCVEGLVGRDASGAPCWRIVHEANGCGQAQTLPHSKVIPLVGSTTQMALFCTHRSCPNFRHTRNIETIHDLRRKERREKELDAKAAAEAQQAAEQEAAKKQTNEARMAALQRQYRTYWLHQIQTDIEESKIAPFSRWCQLYPSDRERLLEICRTDPTARIYGL